MRRCYARRTRKGFEIASIVFGGWLVAVASAAAQEPDSRAEELRRLREQKATALQPYEPSGLARLLLWLENSRTVQRFLNPTEGFYPKIGTVTPGGGLAYGAGYRKPAMLNRNAVFSAIGLASLKGYWLMDARLTFPEIANGRVSAELSADAYDYRAEAFFGLGPDSRRRAESYYGLRNTTAGGQVRLRLGSSGSIGAGIDYLAPDVDGGSRDVSVRDRFSEEQIPGLAEQTDFGRYFAFAELNTREPRGNPRTGGLYSARYERFDALDLDRYNFDRVETEVQQYFSVFNQRRVLALRGLVSTSAADAGQQVPFYLMRTLGGPDDLRGFRRHRFRDSHLLLLQAEYRWEVFTAMDAALFADWGKVASRRRDINFRDLEHDYGFGVRFGTANGVFLRIEGAFGSRDGKHYVFRFGNVF